MKKALTICGCLLVGFCVGGFVVGRIADRIYAENVQAVLLSDAALRATQCTVLLRGIREGYQEGVSERLESMLDFALIDVAREYTVGRDRYEAASNSVTRAREYRATYPHKSSLARIDREVASALTIGASQSP
jgi:hypothetical protein